MLFGFCTSILSTILPNSSLCLSAPCAIYPVCVECMYVYCMCILSEELSTQLYFDCYFVCSVCTAPDNANRMFTPLFVLYLFFILPLVLFAFGVSGFFFQLVFIPLCSSFLAVGVLGRGGGGLLPNEMVDWLEVEVLILQST